MDRKQQGTSAATHIAVLTLAIALMSSVVPKHGRDIHCYLVRCSSPDSAESQFLSDHDREVLGAEVLRDRSMPAHHRGLGSDPVPAGVQGTPRVGSTVVDYLRGALSNVVEPLVLLDANPTGFFAATVQQMSAMVLQAPHRALIDLALAPLHVYRMCIWRSAQGGYCMGQATGEIALGAAFAFAVGVPWVGVQGVRSVVDRARVTPDTSDGVAAPASTLGVIGAFGFRPEDSRSPADLSPEERYSFLWFHMEQQSPIVPRDLLSYRELFPQLGERDIIRDIAQLAVPPPGLLSRSRERSIALARSMAAVFPEPDRETILMTGLGRPLTSTERRNLLSSDASWEPDVALPIGEQIVGEVASDPKLSTLIGAPHRILNETVHSLSASQRARLTLALRIRFRKDEPADPDTLRDLVTAILRLHPEAAANELVDRLDADKLSGTLSTDAWAALLDASAWQQEAFTTLAKRLTRARPDELESIVGSSPATSAGRPEMEVQRSVNTVRGPRELDPAEVFERPTRAWRRRQDLRDESIGKEAQPDRVARRVIDSMSADFELRLDGRSSLATHLGLSTTEAGPAWTRLIELLPDYLNHRIGSDRRPEVASASLLRSVLSVLRDETTDLRRSETQYLARARGIVHVYEVLLSGGTTVADVAVNQTMSAAERLVAWAEGIGGLSPDETALIRGHRFGGTPELSGDAQRVRDWLAEDRDRILQIANTSSTTDPIADFSERRRRAVVREVRDHAPADVGARVGSTSGRYLATRAAVQAALRDAPRDVEPHLRSMLSPFVRSDQLTGVVRDAQEVFGLIRAAKTGSSSDLETIAMRLGAEQAYHDIQIARALIASTLDEPVLVQVRADIAAPFARPTGFIPIGRLGDTLDRRKLMRRLIRTEFEYAISEAVTPLAALALQLAQSRLIPRNPAERRIALLMSSWLAGRDIELRTDEALSEWFASAPGVRTVPASYRLRLDLAEIRRSIDETDALNEDQKRSAYRAFALDRVPRAMLREEMRSAFRQQSSLRTRLEQEMRQALRDGDLLEARSQLAGWFWLADDPSTSWFASFLDSFPDDFTLTSAELEQAFRLSNFEGSGFRTLIDGLEAMPPMDAMQRFRDDLQQEQRAMDLAWRMASDPLSEPLALFPPDAVGRTRLIAESRRRRVRRILDGAVETAEDGSLEQAALRAARDRLSPPHANEERLGLLKSALLSDLSLPRFESESGLLEWYRSLPGLTPPASTRVVRLDMIELREFVDEANFLTGEAKRVAYDRFGLERVPRILLTPHARDLVRDPSVLRQRFEGQLRVVNGGAQLRHGRDLFAGWLWIAADDSVAQLASRIDAMPDSMLFPVEALRAIPDVAHPQWFPRFATSLAPLDDMVAFDRLTDLLVSEGHVRSTATAVISRPLDEPRRRLTARDLGNDPRLSDIRRRRIAEQLEQARAGVEPGSVRAIELEVAKGRLIPTTQGEVLESLMLSAWLAGEIIDLATDERLVTWLNGIPGVDLQGPRGARLRLVSMRNRVDAANLEPKRGEDAYRAFGLERVPSVLLEPEMPDSPGSWRALQQVIDARMGEAVRSGDPRRAILTFAGRLWLSDVPEVARLGSRLDRLVDEVSLSAPESRVAYEVLVRDDIIAAIKKLDELDDRAALGQYEGIVRREDQLRQALDALEADPFAEPLRFIGPDDLGDTDPIRDTRRAAVRVSITELRGDDVRDRRRALAYDFARSRLAGQNLRETRVGLMLSAWLAGRRPSDGTEAMVAAWLGDIPGLEVPDRSTLRVDKAMMALRVASHEILTEDERREIALAFGLPVHVPQELAATLQRQPTITLERLRSQWSSQWRHALREDDVDRAQSILFASMWLFGDEPIPRLAERLDPLSASRTFLPHILVEAEHRLLVGTLPSAARAATGVADDHEVWLGFARRMESPETPEVDATSQPGTTEAVTALADSAPPRIADIAPEFPRDDRVAELIRRLDADPRATLRAHDFPAEEVRTAFVERTQTRRQMQSLPEQALLDLGVLLRAAQDPGRREFGLELSRIVRGWQLGDHGTPHYLESLGQLLQSDELARELTERERLWLENVHEVGLGNAVPDRSRTATRYPQLPDHAHARIHEELTLLASDAEASNARQSRRMKSRSRDAELSAVHAELRHPESPFDRVALWRVEHPGADLVRAGTGTHVMRTVGIVIELFRAGKVESLSKEGLLPVLTLGQLTANPIVTIAATALEMFPHLISASLHRRVSSPQALSGLDTFPYWHELLPDRAWDFLDRIADSPVVDLLEFFDGHESALAEHRLTLLKKILLDNPLGVFDPYFRPLWQDLRSGQKFEYRRLLGERFEAAQRDGFAHRAQDFVVAMVGTSESERVLEFAGALRDLTSERLLPSNVLEFLAQQNLERLDRVALNVMPTDDLEAAIVDFMGKIDIHSTKERVGFWQEWTSTHDGRPITWDVIDRHEGIPTDDAIEFFVSNHADRVGLLGATSGVRRGRLARYRERRERLQGGDLDFYDYLEIIGPRLQNDEIRLLAELFPSREQRLSRWLAQRERDRRPLSVNAFVEASRQIDEGGTPSLSNQAREIFDGD